MANTDDLIESLSNGAAPVRRLRPPVARALGVAVLATIVIALLTWMRGLRAAVAELPPGQREAVELLKLKEMSLKEASAATGQSETALKVAVHRAVKRLRVILGDEVR